MEDYKEKYEKVLKKVQELFKKGEENKYLTINAWRTEFEEICPELRESEDERIRKEIICFLRNIPNSNYTCEEMAAWLEKQGEKPADKVEPKFEIGDWVVYDHRAYQVVELPKKGYINLGLKRNGKIEFAPSTYCRLWTIQDAKDGDVLSYRDGQWCFIYKGIVTEDTFKYYALLSEKGITVNDAAFCLLTSCFTPATKEQRDILMEAMADAGYVFDFEKKKLKKIEQKPAVNKVKLEFKKGDILYEQETMTILLVHGRSGNWLQVFCHYWMLKEKFTAKPPYENYGIVQKMSLVPASEEQKKLLLKKIKEEGYEWDADKLELKYLGKNEQKPAWSDEDEDAIAEGIIALEGMYDPDEPERCYAGYTLPFNKAAERLKSLRAQNRWKPSDLQIEALESVAENCAYSEYQDCLRDLAKQLKKLKA